MSAIADQAANEEKATTGLAAQGDDVAATSRLARAARLRAGPSFDGPSLALALIACVAVFHTLRIGADLFMPIMLALLGRFAFGPVIRQLERVGIAAPFGAALLVGGLAVGTIATGYVLSEPAKTWIERAPATLRQIEQKIRFLQRPVVQVVEATQDVTDAADVVPDSRETVVVEGPSLLSGFIDRTQSLFVVLLVTATLLFFMLSAGDGFFRKLTLVMPWREGGLGTPDFFEQVERDISRQLLMVTLINVALGIAVAAAMWFLDMPSPLLWGVLAGVLNFIPYAGAVATAFVIGAVALISFDQVLQSVIAVSVFLVLNGVEGFLITPLLLGRRLALSAFAVLVSVMVWSWLWGAAGAILAVPLLTALRILCEHVESLHWLGNLLGDDRAPAA